MNARTSIARIATAAAVLVALATPTAADAAPHVNVLAHQCSSTRTTTCIEPVKLGSHRIVVHDRHTHRHTYRGQQQILAGLKRWSVPCRLENSPRCYWDASSAGNGVGWSFFVIGAEHVVYLRKI